MHRLTPLGVFLCAIAAVLPAQAQDPAPSREDRIKKLEQKVKMLQDEIDELYESSEEQSAPTQQARLNLMNPTITVIHNCLLRVDNHDVVETHHHGGSTETLEVDDRFLLRETEVDFRAAVDPYADAVLIVALESEAPGEFEVDVEEGYITVKSLPFPLWEEPPLATTIKAGRFLANIGGHNMLHTHDLPQSLRGLAYDNFVGGHGFIATGVSTRSFVPVFETLFSLMQLDELAPSISDSATTLTLEVSQGGGFKLVHHDHDGKRLTYVANLTWFNTFADEHDFQFGLIGVYGNNDEDGRRPVQMYSADFMYRWKPLRQGEWNSVLVAGQLFWTSQEFAEEGPPPVSGVHRAFGGFAYVQYQLDERWYFGVRGDWIEELENRRDATWRVGPYISCYISEFFRLRAGYEHTGSDVEEKDDLDTFLLEANVVFGAHPPHPYWVNF